MVVVVGSEEVKGGGGFPLVSHARRDAAWRLTWLSAGIRMARSTEMMEITTSSSTSVKAPRQVPNTWHLRPRRWSILTRGWLGHWDPFTPPARPEMDRHLLPISDPPNPKGPIEAPSREVPRLEALACRITGLG